MPSDLNLYFSGILSSLREAEVEQKKRYDSAIDIEDIAEVTAVTIDARTKIQQLRKWIEALQHISAEVKTVFPAWGLPTQNQGATHDIEISPDDTERPAVASGLLVPSLKEGFDLFGKHYPATNWRELLVKLCEAMVLKKPYKIASLGANTQASPFGRPVLCLDGQQIESRGKLSSGFYIDTSGSDNEIKTRCEYILSACGYSSEVLQIFDGGRNNGCN